MRVIAGEARGRRLLAVPGASTRPISDRVKEALFGVLGERVMDGLFLDLFAGTGSVGIEALSRGARQATFVEMRWRAIKTIERNLETTGLEGRGRVIRQDVFKFLQSQALGAPYDIVYLAPPQYRGLWAKTLRAVDQADILAKDGVIVAQMYPKEYETLTLESLALTDQRRYGSTMLCFYAPRTCAPSEEP